jgi:hypothetical protein
MQRFDRLFAGITLGLVIPVVIMCLSWWGSYLFGLGDTYVKWGAIVGLLVGLFLDKIVLRGLVNNFYNLSLVVLFALYLSYSVGLLGFFMGVPVFNVFVGAAAGVYTGRKAKINGQDRRKFREALKKTAVLATVVLLAVCSFSTFVALVDSSTAANLQGMLHLGFEITRMMIWSLIVLGGLALLAVQLLLVYTAGKAAYNK